MPRRRIVLGPLAAFLLCACGDAPPPSVATPRIEEAVPSTTDDALAPVEAAIPEGVTWFCFRETHMRWSGCTRDLAGCEDVRAGVAVEFKKQTGTPAAVTDCTEQSKAACYTYANKLSGDVESLCVQRLSDCEASRAKQKKKTVDYGNVSRCEAR